MTPAPAAQPDRTLDRLTDFVHAAAARPLNAAMIDALILRVLDSLACAAAARATPEAARLLALPGVADGDACALIGGGRATLDGAAFFNSFLIRQLDWNDTYVGRNGGHPSDMFGAVLAACEHAGRTGAQTLRAIAVANHVMLDLCDAANAIARGWDPSTFVALAATAGCAAALDLTRAQARHALAMSAVSSPMLMGRVGKVSSWKGLASAAAVRASLFEALLARADMTGPDPAFEGEYGFATRISGPLDLELDIARDRTDDSHVKFYPAVYHAQATLELGLRLSADLHARFGAGAAARITSVEVDIYEFALRFAADTPDKWAPANIETADHSIPFMTAHALARGAFGLGALHETLHDDTVRALAAKVLVRADAAFTAAFPAHNGARVTIVADGERLVAETAAALGHPSRRLTREDARAKFMQGAGELVDPDRARAWMARVEAIAQAPGVAGLLAP